MISLLLPVPPTLTLWVGTVSGKVAAYGVNIVPEKEGEAKNHRKIELIPTSTCRSFSQ